MAEPAEDWEDWIVTHLDVSHLTTEDDEPVDNFYQERQMDILTEALRVSWEEGKPFVQGADIGVFSRIDQEAVVPDVMLATGVEMPEDVMAKERRSYFIWNFGKPPDIVIEIVSNKKGGEDTRKLKHYAKIKVPYYVIYDPEHHLSSRTIRVFQISGASYIEKLDTAFPEIGLSLMEWEGEFSAIQSTWLRWATLDGKMLALGSEEKARADEEKARADEAIARADEAIARAEKMAEKLRELGLNPDEL